MISNNFWKNYIHDFSISKLKRKNIFQFHHDEFLIEIEICFHNKFSICYFFKMLKNASTLAIVAVHTIENKPPKVYESPQKNIYLKHGNVYSLAELA